VWLDVTSDDLDALKIVACSSRFATSHRAIAILHLAVLQGQQADAEPSVTGTHSVKPAAQNSSRFALNSSEA
jgi:hypothetical protein